MGKQKTKQVLPSWYRTPRAVPSVVMGHSCTLPTQEKMLKDSSLWQLVRKTAFYGSRKLRKNESFFGNFWSETLVSNTFCARVWWNAEACLVQNSKKLRSPTREAKKSNTQPLSRTLNLARCTQRKAPSSSHQPVCMALHLEVSNKAPALPIELT